MASLREIKDRIGSVRSTLKITSAMKLVASAKLRKAQRAIEALRPYERTLAEIYTAIGSAGPAAAPSPLSSSASLTLDPVRVNGSEGALPFPADRVTPTAVVAIASNSSLCGGFNAAVIRKTLAVVKKWEQDGAKVTVFSVGRKMADAMRKAGYPSPADYTKLADTPSYEGAAALADTLIAAFDEGRFDRVELIYNHFHSTASQAAQMAQEARAKRLVIGHFSARYEDESLLLKESQAIFPQTLLAKENLRITL
jgi:F-type H+-transporting ATPase subunit gamma